MPNPIHILVIDEDQARTALLRRALQDAGYDQITSHHETSRIDLLVARIQPDVVIIDIESPTRDNLEQMNTINLHQPRPVIMYSGDDDQATITRALKAGVSAYIIDELKPQRVKPILEVAIARFREYKALRDELDQVKNSLEDRKIIDKAKGLLMKHRHCSEEDAYQTLRKQAMNQNLRIAELAKNLVNSVEMLG